MEFTVDRQAMIKTVTMVEAVSRGAQVLEILKSLRITVEDGRVEVLGSDHACYLSAYITPSENGAVVAGQILVDAKRLLGFLRSLDDDEIGLQTTESGKHLNILSGAGKSRLLCQDAGEFPTLKRDSTPVVDVAKTGEFIEFLSSIYPYSLWEGSAVKLQAVCLNIDDEGITGLATDQRRAVCATLPYTALHTAHRRFLITNRAARAICQAFSKTDDQPLSIRYQDGQLVLETEDAFFLARTLDVEYPYDQMVNQFLKHDDHESIIFDAEPMLRRLGRVALVADWQTPIVRFQFLGDKLVIGTEESAKAGDVEETITVEGDAEGSLLTVVRLMVDAIQQTECGRVRMKVRDKAPAFVSGAWGDKVKRPFTHLSAVMPIVPRKPEVTSDEQA